MILVGLAILFVSCDISLDGLIPQDSHSSDEDDPPPPNNSPYNYENDDDDRFPQNNTLLVNKLVAGIWENSSSIPDCADETLTDLISGTSITTVKGNPEKVVVIFDTNTSMSGLYRNAGEYKAITFKRVTDDPAIGNNCGTDDWPHDVTEEEYRNAISSASHVKTGYYTIIGNVLTIIGDAKFTINTDVAGNITSITLDSYDLNLYGYPVVSLLQEIENFDTDPSRAKLIPLGTATPTP